MSTFSLARLALVGLLGAIVGCQKPAPTLAPSKPPDVLVAKPVAQQVTDFEEFTGHTEAVATVELKAQVTGYLKEIKFKDGAEVVVDVDEKENKIVFQTSAATRKKKSKQEVEA